MSERLFYLSIEGMEGLWWVKVPWEDGSVQMLPTAHYERFYDPETRVYRRMDREMERRPGVLRRWCELIYRTHKVVVTESDWRGETPRRKGYVSLNDISELEFHCSSGAAHSFKLGDPYYPKGGLWLPRGPSGRAAEILKLASRAEGVSATELNALTQWRGAPWKWLFSNWQKTGYCDRWGYNFEVERTGEGVRYHATRNGGLS